MFSGLETLTQDMMGGLFKGFKSVTMFLLNLVLSSSASYGWLESTLEFKDTDFLIITEFWKLLMPIAMTILIIGFLFELQETMFRMQGNEVFKAFIMPFFKLLAGYTVLANGVTLVNGLLGVNNYFIKACQKLELDPALLSNSDKIDVSGLTDVVDGMGLYEHLFCWIGLLIVWVIQMLPAIVMYYNAFARKFEMILRVGVLPIACGDLFSRDVWNSTGVRALKKILALGLYGGGMIIILKTASALQTTYMMESFSHIELEFVVEGMQNGSVLANMFGSSLNNLWLSTGGGLVAVFMLIKVLIYSAMILMAGVGACSMTKQACNEVLGC